MQSVLKLDSIPPDLRDRIDSYRDVLWRRDESEKVRNAGEAERFVDDVGIAFALTDYRNPGPSLFTAVCGRRDAVLPRNVQKDPESSLTWTIKDEVLRRGKVYYAKLFRNRATFLARRLIPSANTLFGVPRTRERNDLTENARKILKILRKEWEMATSDLRDMITQIDRKAMTAAIDELQKTLKVVPSEVIYEPWFTYVWTLAETRFASELGTRPKREEALITLAEAYLDATGIEFKGELSRMSGLSRVEAGHANNLLVQAGKAVRLETGVYLKSSLL
jgi:hypothetical protein